MSSVQRASATEFMIVIVILIVILILLLFERSPEIKSEIKITSRQRPH